MDVRTHCRLCEGSCGVVAELDGGRLVRLRPDPDDPVSGGRSAGCAALAASLDPDLSRPLRPLRRREGRTAEASWDEALRDVGAAVRAAIREAGPGAVALVVGEEAWRSSRVLVRALGLGMALGTPHVLGELALGPGPRLRAAEWALGWPAPLLADLARTQFALLLGGDALEVDLGPWQAGLAPLGHLLDNVAHRRARAVVAGPRRTALADRLGGHVAVRPGTEAWLLVGLLSAVVSGGRHDRWFVERRTAGFEALSEALRPWTVERCARACGVEPGEIAGLALRMSRAAMATVHPGPAAFVGPHAAVAAWAWVALHAVTANLLRPGGAYDHEAPFDPYVFLAGARLFRPRGAPPGPPPLLLQSPATALPRMDPRPRVLLCVEADPLGRLPGLAWRRAADLLVALTRHGDTATARAADWVLPLAHPWEEDHLTVFETAFLPRDLVLWTPALRPPAGGARPAEDVLRDLLRAARPPLRGSAWPAAARLLGRLAAGADLERWERRAVEWVLGPEGAAALQGDRHRLDRGESDRSPWRVDLPGERVALLPEPAAEALAALADPEEVAGHPLALSVAPRRRRGGPPVREPVLRVHPEAGPAEGAEVTVRTPWGSATARVAHDPALRRDVAELPGAVELAPPEPDRWTGAPRLAGLPARVE